MLSAQRNQKAAKRFLLRPYAEETSARAVRFFKKALKARHNKQPRVINVDKNAAYPPAIENLKEEKALFKLFATDEHESDRSHKQG